MKNDISKKYYRIREVAEILDLPQSTLRFWEKEFPESAPVRTPTNQRLYTPEKMETLRLIRFLLKDKGLKTAAAREQLRINRQNVERRLDVISKLQGIRDELSEMLKAFSKRR